MNIIVMCEGKGKNNILVIVVVYVFISSGGMLGVEQGEIVQLFPV